MSKASPPLRVSIVEPSGQLYGSEFCLLDILEHLDRGRFEPEVILPAGAPLVSRLRRLGVPTAELLRRSDGRRGRLRRLPAYARMAWRWLRRRPALVYVNQGGVLRPAAALAARLAIPVLCQVQTLEDAEWVSSLSRCHRRVAAFVCNSRFIAERTAIPPDRRSTVYYGYRWKGLRRDHPPGPLRPDRLEVGLLGRICESKGHYLVVEAARRLAARSVGAFHFRFIGDAPTPADLRAVRDLVERAGVAHLIEFRGYREDIGAELAEIDLLAIPSLAEPFGRVLCEAAEAQVPVLLADSGGLGELSHRFGVAVRFRPADVDDFLAALGRIARDYALVRREFLIGADRLLQSLDIKAYVRVIEGLISSAAAGGPAAVCWLGTDPATEEPPCASST